MFRTLRNRIKKVDRSSLKTLWVSINEEGEYCKDTQKRQIYETKEEIHTALLKRNETHLNQAYRTPFATGPLQKGLKWDGTGPLAGDMLTGEVLNQQQFNLAMLLRMYLHMNIYI